METKEKNPKVRKMIGIVNFVGEMVMWSLNYFDKMEALQAVMKKHNINIESSSYNSSSHGHALSSCGLSFIATSTSSYDEWLIDYGESYHMVKDRAIFFSLNEHQKNVCW
jgi:hypothetical protein